MTNHLRRIVLRGMQEEVSAVNHLLGWRGPDARTNSMGDDVALLHSEVSEIFEAYRDHGLEDATATWPAVPGKPPKPEGVGSEAADVLIRLLDFVDRWGVDLLEEYERKVAYNRTRPHLHGGKLL